VRFITGGNEYVVRCYSMSALALEQQLPAVERFLADLDVGRETAT
jgi:hypothetical protein